MQKETKNNVNTIHRQLRDMLAHFLAVIGLFLGPGSEAVIRYFVPPVPLRERQENYEAKKGGKKSIHFNGSNETIELLLRTVISANQLSIYGAIADLCDEVPKRITVRGKPAAPQHLEKVEIPTVLSKAENSTNEQQWGNLRQEYERKFEQLSEDQKLWV